MKTWEIIYSILAVVLGLALVSMLLSFPELRQFNRLFAICLVGLAVNVGLMVIVLRDIFHRPFNSPTMRLIWLVLVLFIWPSIVYYLFRHGFRPRN